MKKIFAVLFLTILTACGTMETETKTPATSRRAANVEKVTPDEALKGLKLGCSQVKAVNDPENGKIFYTSKHNLFKYVKVERKDKYFCTESDAEKAGFKPAPEHFSGSVYFFIECLHKEGAAGGKCHDYASGIYKSLQIYDKVCGNPSKVDIAETVESYAKREKDAMDSGKYEGITAALINKYRCK